MTGRDLPGADPQVGAALGRSRSRVLDVLQAAGSHLGVNEIARRVGLHENTARFHLDGLVAAGLAERSTQVREQPGRPRMLYAATSEGREGGRRSYRLLAEILTGYLATSTSRPSQAAKKAGRAWGRRLTRRNEGRRPASAPAATQQLLATLDEVGFASEMVTRGSRRELLVHHCPFLEAAQEHLDVVCSVHLGLMQGMLTELGAPLEVRRLDPLVEPNLCVAHLGNRTSRTRTG